jgi:phosphoglycerol transferase MdoB-like AlkP superfamily enzyme
LKFDHMRKFLRAVRFHKIIDRDDFPPSQRLAHGAWRGYHDDEVMRRADAEFAAVEGQPFFGVIYTMNTHPPFVTPEGFPLLRPDPQTDADHYINALHYADYTVGLMLDLARSHGYFQNTIFIFVADHARTRGQFNLSNQHHIPLLIYAPGYVRARVSSAVVSQTDILPTVLSLLALRARHAAWGRDMLAVPDGEGFALCIAGDEIRWHDAQHLLNDGLTVARPMLFDLQTDPTCTRDIAPENAELSERLRADIRSYLSLSQTLLYANRVAP